MFSVYYVLFSTCLFHFAQCQGFYKAIGSRIIRPNSEYHLAISTQATSEPTTVRATLQGYLRNGTIYTAEDSIVVRAYSSRILKIPVDNIQDGDYKIIVSGRGGVDFHEDFPVAFLDKSYSVFVQTDRAVYQPGTKVLFRAIVLNSELKPAAEVRNELLHISVTDGHGNRVKEWKRIKAVRGVFTGEINLGTRPVLGSWNISVTIHGQTYAKSIDVVEYILPKFMVNIDAPKQLTFKESLLVVNLDTRYNYGANVKGQATVSVFPTFVSGVIQPIFENPYRKVVPINGSTTVNFDIAKELKLSDEYERRIVIDVTVEEAETGQRQNNSVEVHLHKYDYKMDLIKTADYFKPGLPYVAFVKISNHDGSAVNKLNEITVRHGYSRVEDVYAEEKKKIGKNGVVELQFYTPSNVSNLTALRIEVEYEGLKERISPIPAAVSYSNTFLQISLDTDRPIVNLDVEVSVNCTEPLRSIDYVILSRGDVQVANSLQIDARKEYSFRFTATHAMVPVAHLIVSYTREDGEMVGDAIDIEIDGLLQNFMEVQVNPVETEPNLDVELTIRAQPNSFVALMAVDERVANLKQGFDLNRLDVANELRSYDPAKQSPYDPALREVRNHFFWKPGAANPHSSIYDSGADLITNSHINRHKPTLDDIYLRPVFYDASSVKPDRGFGLALHPVTRPPLAGPYAFSRIPRPVWNKPKVYLSQHLDDTWLFSNLTVGYDGKSSLRRKVPSTSTTWTLSGFSLDPLHGLGLVTTPKQVKVAKNFQVDLSLPSRIQRGEILNVPIVVFNHWNRDVSVEVTMHNPELKFEFVDETNATGRIELYRRKKVNVAKEGRTALSFLILAKQQGLIEIKVTANSARNQDVVVKNLLVMAEGETEYYTKTVLIDLRAVRNYKNSLNFTIPLNVVPGSEIISASAVGDLLGPTIINLGHLIRLPTGCGEQNLINFASNIIVLNYLKASNGKNPISIENEALNLLELAYQNQLSYQRSDGTFSPFGSKDTNSSVFLTAYTVIEFIQAKQFIYVDDRNVETILEWLSNIQGRDGSFVETGEIIYTDLQQSSEKSLALTAFTLLAFVESRDPLYTNTINKGLDYIARYIDEADSTYTIALCSYVLHLTRHTAKQSALNLLEARAKSRGNMKWWAKDTPNDEKKNPWNYLPKSVDIETTAYALLSIIEAGYLEDAVPVLQWLVDQQNSMGGFGSSRDTATALLALNKLAVKLSSNVNLQIEFQHSKQATNNFHVNQNNAMIVQSVPLSKDTRIINVTAQGEGLALFRINYQYNMNVSGPWPLFTLDPQVDKNSNKDHLQLSICTAFVSKNLTETSQSNMAVMEVNFPSGFTVDIDALPSLEVSEHVQRVDTSHGLNTVILYFNNLTSSEEYCPTVSAFRTHKVANQKPVSVVVYDYYDTSRRARIFYTGKPTTTCDICDDQDCDERCNSVKANLQVGSRQEENGKGAAFRVSSTFLPLLFIVFNLV